MDQAEFEAAIAAKLAPVEEAETTEHVEPEEVEAPVEVEAEAPEVEEPEDRPRDEKGRFAPKEQERPEWLPPQFKSVEDFTKSYFEAQSVIGRQGQELGELRRMVEQIAERSPAEQPVSLGDPQEVDDPRVLEAAALQALKAGHIPGESPVMDQILDAWYELAPRSAARFERELDLARLKHEFSQEVQPSIETVRQESLRRAAQVAQRELKSVYQDFDQVMESIAEEDLAGLNPDVIRQLQETDPKAAIELVYRWVKASKAEQLAQARSASREAEKAEKLAEKRQATVASSSGTPASREKSNIEQFKEALLVPEAHSVYHGLVRE